MATIRRVMQGVVAKRNGVQFERLLKAGADREKWTCIQIPMGAKMVGANRMVRVRTPFDFVFVRSGQAIFADAKSTKSLTFSHSMVERHQVDALRAVEVEGCPAGYIVLFQDLNQVVFFRALQLAALTRGKSLRPEDGIYMGNRLDVRISAITVLAQARTLPAPIPLRDQ